MKGWSLEGSYFYAVGSHGDEGEDDRHRRRYQFWYDVDNHVPSGLPSRNTGCVWIA